MNAIATAENVTETYLSPQQTAIIQECEKNILAISGPGSGKTFTMIQKNIAIFRHYPAAKILNLAFNRHSAIDISKKCEANGLTVTTATLHEFALSLVMKNRTLLSEVYDYPASVNISICDEFTEAFIIDDTLRNFNKKMKGKHNLGELKKQYPNLEKTVRLSMREAGLITFDEIIPIATTMIKNDVLIFKYTHVLIDESQDLSKEQYEFLLVVKALVNQLIFLGDLDQAIYSWRGADPESFLLVPEKFDTRILPLTVSYRCPQEICDIANNLITNNIVRYDKTLVSGNDRTGIINYHNFTNENERIGAFWEMVDKLLDIVSENDLPYEEVAILCRTNYDVKVIREQLISKGIPVSFSSQGTVHEFVSALLVLCESVIEQESVNVTCEPGLKLIDPNASFVKIEMQSLKSGRSKFSIVDDGLLGNFDYFKNDSISFLGEIHRKERNNLTNPNSDELCKQIRNILNAMATMEISKVTGNKIRILELLSEVNKTNGITVSTVHGAKGLEWDHVILFNFSEDVFPHKNTVNHEEERRLAYVAVTRTKQYLTILSNKHSAYSYEMGLAKEHEGSY